MFKWPHYNEFDKQIQGRVGRLMKQGEAGVKKTETREVATASDMFEDTT